MENLNEKLCIFQESLGINRLVPVGGETVWPNSAVTDRASSARELIEQGLGRGPECHAHLAGLGFRSRLSPRLPDREALCAQAARIGVATSRGDHPHPPPSPPYPQMRAAEVEDQVVSGTMSTAPKTSQEATT
jgi:hypothetical protein